MQILLLLLLLLLLLDHKSILTVHYVQGYVDSTRLSASVSDVRRMSKSAVVDTTEKGSDVTTSPVTSAHRGYVIMANHNWISLFRERAYTR